VIPRDYISAWGEKVPWRTLAQVEQDLVVSRAMTEIFTQAVITEQMVMRGGTAFHKLLLDYPGRYSEDIDLVMRKECPTGELIDAVRSILDPWLGTPRRDWREDRLAIKYRFESSEEPVQPMRLKVEINPVEHLSLLPTRESHFEMANPWFTGTADIAIYHPDQMFGSKMRALYGRRKGRDLFDLWLALESDLVDPSAVVESFQAYGERHGEAISRAMFEANLISKFKDRRFHDDLAPLLPADSDYDPDAAVQLVLEELVSRLPGEPWQGEGDSPGS